MKEPSFRFGNIIFRYRSQYYGNPYLIVRKYDHQQRKFVEIDRIWYLNSTKFLKEFEKFIDKKLMDAEFIDYFVKFQDAVENYEQFLEDEMG